VIQHSYRKHCPYRCVCPLAKCCYIRLQHRCQQFSEAPSTNCAQRLKLLDGSGWVSVKRSDEPPLDTVIMQLQGVVPAADVKRATAAAAAALVSGVRAWKLSDQQCSDSGSGGVSNGDSRCNSSSSAADDYDDDETDPQTKAELQKIKASKRLSHTLL
jgi:hypothetical protein